MMRTGPLGACARRRNTRSSVSRLTGSMRRHAKFAAGRPPKAIPRWWTMPSSLAVRLAARGATLSARGSPKIRRGHMMVAHRNRRAWTRRWTVRPCEGRSMRCRSYRLWTRPDRRPHSGQAASHAVGRAMISSRSGSAVTASMRSPAGDTDWNDPRRTASSLRLVLAKPIRPAPRVSQSPFCVPIDSRWHC